MAFWTTVTEPKRQFRFKVQISSFEDGAIWYAKTVTKPGFEISEGTHKYLGHTFHFPGSLTWSDVTVTLVDPATPDAADRLMSIIEQSGYKLPERPSSTSGAEIFGTIGKTNMSPAIGEVRISQLDTDGNELEVWTLNNAIIKGIELGDLSYDSDDLSTIQITFAYDWAQLQGSENTYFSTSA